MLPGFKAIVIETTCYWQKQQQNKEPRNVTK